MAKKTDVGRDRLQKEHTETEKVILNRRSVRLYRDEQVPEFMVQRILEAGRFAPSAGNCQPWKFVVIRDPAVIEEISKGVVRLVKLFRAVLDYRRPWFYWLRPLASLFIRLNRYELHPVPFGAVDLIARGKLGVWHGAPTVILIFRDVRGVGSPELDCGIVGQNMVLAAHSMGLGTCWVSFAKPAFKYMRKWHRFFGITHPYKFMTSLAVGWPRGKPDGMVRRDTRAVDWYENGGKRTIVQGSMPPRKLGFLEKLFLPDYRNIDQVRWGELAIDEKKCTGCGICAQACPADSLVVADRKARQKPMKGTLTSEEGLNQCMSCGDCVAICPKGAIQIAKPYRWTKYYKTLDRGELAEPRL